MISKLRTFEERVKGLDEWAADGTAQELRNDVIDDMENKINEIIDWINKQR